MENFDELINVAINKATESRGHINILIAGRSGVGKSTLINAVFQSDLAETGQGQPVTQNTREITKEGIPLSIFDTRGLEMNDFSETLGELEEIINERCNDRDENRHIHLAWICIQEDGRRVEDAEIKLHGVLTEYVPVISVITKARSDQGFKDEVLRLLPESKSVVRVRAIEETFDDGQKLQAMGLEKLINASSEVIPEGKRNALAASQKADLKYKKERAHKTVAAAATAAAVAGASPIPFSDAAILAPIQIGMIADISSVFGMELSKAALSTIVSSAIGVTGATFLGRAIVSNALKFVPGIGSIAGGAISATTASIITVALGEAYISVLMTILQENPDKALDVDEIVKRLKERMKKN